MLASNGKEQAAEKGIKQIEFSPPRQKTQPGDPQSTRHPRGRNFYEEKWVVELFKQN